MIKTIHNAFDVAADLCLRFRFLRSSVRYISNRFDGFQYSSYSLSDEAALALSFIDNSRKGWIVDGGANKGNYTNALLNAKTSIYKILMIEPSPSLHDHLKSLSEAVLNIEFEAVAIGSSSGKLDLFFDKEGSSFASLYQRDIRHVGVEMNHSTEVTVMTLDDIAIKYDLSVIDYLKLDLEGHELEALKGAKSLFQQKKIRALTFEFGGCNVDSRTFFKDFWQLLVYEYGFKMYRIAPGRKLISLRSYSESLERFSWQNILACAPGIKPQWKVIL